MPSKLEYRPGRDHFVVVTDERKKPQDNFELEIEFPTIRGGMEVWQSRPETEIN